MASSKEWWQKYHEALSRGDKAAAAEAFQKYLEAKRAEGKGSSRPMLVNLSTKAKDYRNAVPLEEIPDEMEKSPEFFELLRRMEEK